MTDAFDPGNDRPTLERISMELGTVGGDLNLKQLYYFHAVAVEGTIAGAAKRLRVAQATISEQLKNLEDYLEAPLVERRTTGVRLNQHGRRLFDHTTSLFRGINRMLQDLSPERAKDRWVLEVGVCPTIVRTFAIDRFLPLFEVESVSLRIRNGRYEDMMESLLTGDLDVLITENRPTAHEAGKVGHRLLLNTPLVFVAPPEMAERIEAFPHDLGKLPFVSYSPSSRYRLETDAFLNERGVSPRVIAEVDDPVLMATAAERGLCFAAVPRKAVEDQLERGLLRELGPVEGSQSSVYALYQSAKTPQVILRAVAALVDASIQGVADSPA